MLFLKTLFKNLYIYIFMTSLFSSKLFYMFSGGSGNDQREVRRDQGTGVDP
jgi:hypothetical protein